MPIDVVHTGHGGANESPHLRWAGFPEETQSFAVTMFDPDAPTGCGWWHWMLLDVPRSTQELARGAGAGDDSAIPPGSFQLPNSYGEPGYGGSGPPAGDQVHHYYTAVHALDVERLGIDATATHAVAGFHLTAHTLARAVMITNYQV
jgi:Raf kinase inhibitor-like YbhB/YbcL family protein